MSRVGRAPIPVPSGVKVNLDDDQICVEGAKGKLSLTLPPACSIEVKDQQLHVRYSTEEDADPAMHGLYRALVANMVLGVTTGFSKELEIVGVGYRAQVQGKTLSLSVGFSHPVIVTIPEGITIETPKPTIIVVKGSDKQLVGQIAAQLRRIAPPEPYKGKGIRFVGEVVRRKAGKAATGSGAKGGG